MQSFDEQTYGQRYGLLNTTQLPWEMSKDSGQKFDINVKALLTRDIGTDIVACLSTSRRIIRREKLAFDPIPGTPPGRGREPSWVPPPAAGRLPGLSLGRRSDPPGGSRGMSPWAPLWVWEPPGPPAERGRAGQREPENYILEKSRRKPVLSFRYEMV